MLRAVWVGDRTSFDKIPVGEERILNSEFETTALVGLEMGSGYGQTVARSR